jgi:DNA-binding transcriptional ArsR family regulator
MRPDEIFTALADATRRDIVESLSERGASTATQLAADMPITRQAVAKHLTHLHRAELVVPERRGRETRYRLTTDPLSEAIGWLDDVCSRASRVNAA